MKHNSMSLRAIRASKLLIESSSELIKDGGILVSVKDGKIIAAGPWTSITPLLESSTAITSLEGDLTLMPGFIDGHIHISADPAAASTDTSKIRSDKEGILETNALRLLDAGVTTARDLGCPGTLTIDLKRRIKSGEIMGPRLLCANAPITVRGGHCWAMGGEAEGVEEVTEMAKRRLDEGVDVIKVMVTGGFMTAGSHPSEAQYSLEEMKAIADTAHAKGIPVTTHAMGAEGIRRTVEAGFDSLEHCSWSTKTGTQFDPDIASLIVQRGVAVCPTMNTACLAGDNYFCPWDHREKIVENIAKLRQLGAKVFMGTDNGIGHCPFERYADGLQALTDAGYTPRELVACCTDIAADVCGLSKVTGKLLAGYDADVIAVEGNPLESVEAFSRPRFVMARGREHKLTPIAPLAHDHAEKVIEIMSVLRKGAGLKT